MSETVRYVQTIGEPEYFEAHECHGKLVPFRALFCSACHESLNSRQYTVRQLCAELATLRAQLAGVRPLVTLARQIWRDDTSEPETIGMQLVRDLAALGDAPESPRTPTNEPASTDGDT